MRQGYNGWLGQIGATQIYIENMESCLGWLDDNIMNAMMDVWATMRDAASPPIYIFHSFFFPSCAGVTPPHDLGWYDRRYDFSRVRRWTRRLPENYMDFPIVTCLNIPGHWILVVILPKGHANGHATRPTLHFFDGFRTDHTRYVSIISRWYIEEQITRLHREPIP
jgi:Ulp1 family protease